MMMMIVMETSTLDLVNANTIPAAVSAPHHGHERRQQHRPVTMHARLDVARLQKAQTTLRCVPNQRRMSTSCSGTTTTTTTTSMVLAYASDGASPTVVVDKRRAWTVDVPAHIQPPSLLSTQPQLALWPVLDARAQALCAQMHVTALRVASSSLPVAAGVEELRRAWTLVYHTYDPSAHETDASTTTVEWTRPSKDVPFLVRNAIGGRGEGGAYTPDYDPPSQRVVDMAYVRRACAALWSDGAAWDWHNVWRGVQDAVWAVWGVDCTSAAWGDASVEPAPKPQPQPQPQSQLKKKQIKGRRSRWR
jgi:hypothetical protein